MNNNCICNVCTNTFNKTSRKEIKCICQFSACRECVKAYIESRIEEPCCMNCKVQWDREFMTKNFEKSYMQKQFKQHREKLLFEKEVKLLPSTQIHVENQIKIEDMEQVKRDLLEKIQRLQLEYGSINEKIMQRKNTVPTEKREFVRQCPNNECKGFLSTSLKCPLCNVWACGECREIKGYTSEQKDAHVCNKDILENIKMMQKDSKACPKCAKMIFKIEGCNQMYCTPEFGGCGVTFDWRTLKIETGTIHNPHYFEWIRKNGGVPDRNPLDIQCGREIDNRFINEFAHQLGTRPRMHYNANKKTKDILDIAREIVHIRNVEQPRFRVTNEDNLDIRIMYMRNKLNKEEFMNIIQKRDKHNSKKNEINNVLAMYVNCVTDILYRAYDDVHNNQTKADVNNYVKEIDRLIVYTNECFEKISKSYNCKVYSILNYKFI